MERHGEESRAGEDLTLPESSRNKTCIFKRPTVVSRGVDDEYLLPLFEERRE